MNITISGKLNDTISAICLEPGFVVTSVCVEANGPRKIITVELEELKGGPHWEAIVDNSGRYAFAHGAPISNAGEAGASSSSPEQFNWRGPNVSGPRARA